MKINGYQKGRWNEIYLNLLKFATIKQEVIQLKHTTQLKNS
jgi:hypothetical protein